MTMSWPPRRIPSRAVWLRLHRAEPEAAAPPRGRFVVVPCRPKRYDALAGIVLAPVTRWLILARERVAADAPARRLRHAWSRRLGSVAPMATIRQ